MIRAHSDNASPVELLENRRLLSAGVVNGMLVVVGTNGPDRIVMWQDVGAKGPVITGFVDALLFERPPETFEVPAEGVRSILVRALAGDDTVDLFNAPV